MKAALALLAAAVALMAGCGGSTPAVTPRPSTPAASPSAVPEAPVAVEPTQQPDVTEAATDRRYATCKEARSHGLGPYTKGTDPEYDWYRDADGDGIVCESTR